MSERPDKFTWQPGDLEMVSSPDNERRERYARRMHGCTPEAWAEFSPYLRGRIVEGMRIHIDAAIAVADEEQRGLSSAFNKVSALLAARTEQLARLRPSTAVRCAVREGRAEGRDEVSDERRERYAAAAAEADGWTYQQAAAYRDIANAAMAVADEEQQELRATIERVRAVADDLNDGFSSIIAARIYGALND